MNGIKNNTQNAGTASGKQVQSSCFTFWNSKIPTMIRRGAVALFGIHSKKGEKNVERQKRRPQTIVLSPVFAPEPRIGIKN